MGSHPANLAVRFILELGALVAFAWWGWTLGDGITRVVLSVGMPLAAAAVWGTFNVPGDPSRSGKAPVPVPGWLRLLLELGFFTAATIGWFAVGAPVIGIVFAATVVIHYAISYDRLQMLLTARN